jgi:hypothetical protein
MNETAHLSDRGSRSDRAERVGVQHLLTVSAHCRRSDTVELKAFAIA